MNVLDRYRLKIRKFNCLYFLPHFYEVFKKERTLLQNVIVISRLCSKEVLAYCRQCEINFICKYFNFLFSTFLLKHLMTITLQLIYETIIKTLSSNISALTLREERVVCIFVLIFTKNSCLVQYFSNQLFTKKIMRFVAVVRIVEMKFS